MGETIIDLLLKLENKRLLLRDVGDDLDAMFDKFEYLLNKSYKENISELFKKFVCYLDDIEEITTKCNSIIDKDAWAFEALEKQKTNIENENEMYKKDLKYLEKENSIKDKEIIEKDNLIAELEDKIKDLENQIIQI